MSDTVKSAIKRVKSWYNKPKEKYDKQASERNQEYMNERFKRDAQSHGLKAETGVSAPQDPAIKSMFDRHSEIIKRQADSSNIFLEPFEDEPKKKSDKHLKKAKLVKDSKAPERIEQKMKESE